MESAMRANAVDLKSFLRVAALVILAAGGSAAATQNPAAAGPGPYGVAIIKNVMVPMRDGVRLATDIYRPVLNGVPAPGKFPVVLERTPYGKDNSSFVSEGRFFAQHGYVALMQDVRGRFHSEGKFQFAVNEGRDGYDTVEWAARQPWSNGEIGTYGASYMGHVQNAMAALHPPHLRAMFVMVGDGNYYQEGARRGGAFMLVHNLGYIISALATSGRVADSDPEALAALEDSLANLRYWVRAFPFSPYASPLSPAPTYERLFQNYVDHDSYDSYWKRNGYDYEGLHRDFPNIPAYYVTGWYDIFEYGNLENFAALAKLHSAPTRLLVGPWTHNVGTRFAGNVDFGPSAAVSMRDLALRWFDQTLKGENTGILNGPPVKLFVMGGGNGLRLGGAHVAAGREWFSTALAPPCKTCIPTSPMEDGGQWFSTTAWPPPQETSTPFYFHSGGLLSEQMPGDEPATTFVYDPAHPVPTIGGQINPGFEIWGFPDLDGARDQRCSLKIFGCDNDIPLSARHDVLVFQTPPLDSGVVIAGPVTVDLWISSTAPDTDFTAKLIDVAPPNRDYPWGYAMNLVDRIIDVRWSNSFETPDFLKPGEIREVKIDLIGVANRFMKGHRIRVDISSSNFPYYPVNPDTRARTSQPSRLVIAENTVYHDRRHPSHINLPLVPASAVPADPAAAK
jgi:predicted acyl esterase